MEHEYGAGVPRTHPDEEPQSGGVKHEAAHKDQAVGHWQQDVFELLIKSAARVKDRGGRHGLVVPTEVVHGFHGDFLPNPEAMTIAIHKGDKREFRFFHISSQLLIIFDHSRKVCFFYS